VFAKDIKNKIWLLAPYIGDKEMEFVKDAFNTNWIAPLGPNVDKFEEELSTFYHNKKVHIVSSGTAAIHLALKCLNVQQDDIILCQSFTFAGSAFPIVYEKAIPCFVDSELDTWNMDPNFLEDAILYYIKKGKKPKAIITVHLYGMPAKMNEILSLSVKYKIPIIEDAAEAMGSTYYNEQCGTIGDIGIVSFNGNKIITTSGGGALITSNKDHFNKAKYLSNAARENEHYYLHNHVGFNYRMSNVLAGIGRGQLLDIEHKIESKKNIYNTYKSILNKIENIHFLSEQENSFCNRWLTTITLDKKLLDKVSLEKLKKNFDRLNIETRFLWNPMHLQPVFNDANFFGTNVSEKLFKSGLCLPSSISLDIDEIAEIGHLLKEMFYA
jgi:dTDP-4-amino-4,6-dideoxygalactose transaminase